MGAYTDVPGGKNARLPVAGRLLVGLALVLWGAPGRAAAQWTECTPGMRQASAMAYDSGRGVAVLFGGDGAGLLGDTREWNGSVWTLRSAGGPGRYPGVERQRMD